MKRKILEQKWDSNLRLVYFTIFFNKNKNYFVISRSMKSIQMSFYISLQKSIVKIKDLDVNNKLIDNCLNLRGCVIFGA